MRVSILAAGLAVLLGSGAARGAEPVGPFTPGQPVPGQAQLDRAAAILTGKAQGEPDEAARLLDDSVAAGNRDAAFLRGMLYVKGHQAERGAALLAQAAEQGQGEAQNALAMLYLSGDGVRKDEAQAVRWLTIAAEAQVATAQSNLGYLFLSGHGVARDPVWAAELLRQAAGKGVVEAQHNMGWMYQQGEGVPQDAAEAVRWYRLAAEQGYARSQYNLGLLLVADDGGVGQNLPEAVKWLSLATMSPRADVRRQATEQFVAVTRQVPPATLSEGLDEARQWLASRRVY